MSGGVVGGCGGLKGSHMRLYQRALSVLGRLTYDEMIDWALAHVKTHKLRITALDLPANMARQHVECYIKSELSADGISNTGDWDRLDKPDTARE